MHSKGNHRQNEKTTHRMEENICKQCDCQGISLQNLQTVHVAQYQKNKQPNQKMGRRTKETFLQRRHTNGQQAHEKMLNITNHQENADHNHNEILSQTN